MIVKSKRTILTPRRSISGVSYAQISQDRGFGKRNLAVTNENIKRTFDGVYNDCACLVDDGASE
jgi:hypothetical protein